MLVGDIDKGHGVPVSEEGPLMANLSNPIVALLSSRQTHYCEGMSLTKKRKV